MLTHLHIEHFALIDDIDCTFNPNMNVIIGETGSGKSILMQAISLLLGAKSDYDKIRNNETKAFIEGVFVLDESSLNNLKNDYDEYFEDDTLIISRYLDIKGKTIQKINGHNVPLSVIRDISKKLIDVHSPNEELFFYDEKKQINILDNFIFANSSFKDDEIYFNDYKNKYEKILEIESNILKYKHLLEQDIDTDYLNYQLNELKNANIKEHELEDLEEKFASLSSLVNISSRLEKFFLLADEGLNNIFSSKRELDNIHDDSFLELKERYNDCYYSLSDVKNDLENHFKDLLYSASKIEEIKNRLFFLRSLKRKYGSTSKEMIDKMHEIENTLNSLEDANYNINRLNKEKDAFLPILLESGENLNNIRKKYALILQETINKELKDLLFENAEFKINFINTNYSQIGTYKVQFLLSANKGMDALPLKETISLGESSRLLLAFKKVFFDYEHTDTLIFDEIDIGISGKAALAIGNKIKELANLTQVLVISHLGQVACKGDYFYLVKKEVDNDVTKSKITILNKEEGIQEVAKMINNGIEDKKSLELVKSWIKS